MITGNVSKIIKISSEPFTSLKIISLNHYAVTPDSHLGNKSDIFHHNNENNQLKR